MTTYTPNFLARIGAVSIATFAILAISTGSLAAAPPLRAA